MLNRSGLVPGSDAHGSVFSAGTHRVVFVGFRSVHNLRLQMTDSEARVSRARAVLGVEELPPGYHAGVGRSIAPVFEMAVLFDRPLEGGRVSPRAERMFLYLHWRRGGPDRDDYRTGNADPGPLLAEHASWRIRSRSPSVSRSPVSA